MFFKRRDQTGWSEQQKNENQDVSCLGALTPMGIARQVAKRDLAACYQYRCEQGDEKLFGGLGNVEPIEYLFCAFHCAVSRVWVVIDLE